jgi:LacI family transcriptional regulator
MNDIAASAGVSQTTVSLVLNDALGARLSDQTRQRVLDAVKKHGYRMVRRRNRKAVTDDASVIGFVVDEMATDPWCAMALGGVRDKAWEYGLTVSVAVTRGDAEIEKAVQNQMTSQPLLGLIYGTIQTRQIALAPFLQRIPTVLFNCHVEDRSLPSIIPGEFLGGRTATERLIEAGHRRIAMIEGEVWMDSSRDRKKGYRTALTSHDIPFDEDLVRPGNWEPSAGFEQTMLLMKLPRPPTAIFCASDMTAFGCYEALQELGLKIPQDVSVVGYDDREIAQFMRPPLTTVLLPLYEIGVLAAEYLIDHANRPNKRLAQVKVECPLVERDSVGPILSNRDQ